MGRIHGDVELLTTKEVEKALEWSRRGKATRPKIVVQLCETILAKKPKPVPAKRAGLFKKKETE